MKKWDYMKWSVVLFFVIVPCAAVLIEPLAGGPSFRLDVVALKWFILAWGVGWAARGLSKFCVRSSQLWISLMQKGPMH